MRRKYRSVRSREQLAYKHACKMYEMPRIEPWKEHDGGRLECNLKTEEGSLRYLALLALMCDRQNYLCGLCGFPMTAPTFDHQGGRGMNGGKRDDRIEVEGRWQNAAVCFECNGLKGSKRVPYLPHATKGMQ